MANTKAVEREIRFFFSREKLSFLKKKLKKYVSSGSFYELTKMYNNPNPKYDFYRPAIDGRLRLRYSTSIHSVSVGAGLISWKQRIAKHSTKKVRTEREIEYNFDIKDLEKVTQIFENILHCPLVSSYERRRHYYHSPKFSISLDEFPFGLVLEFEFSKNNIRKRDIDAMLRAFNLQIDEASLLSCDDMYKSLCRKNKIKILPDISFRDKTMPRL